MKIELVHHVPGRIRIRSRALYFLEKVKENLVEGLSLGGSFKEVVYTPKTGSLLVRYNPNELSSEDVLEILENQINVFSLLAYQGDREQKNAITVNERRLQEATSAEIMKRVGVSASALIYFAIRYRRNIGRAGEMTSYLSRLASPASLISLALSLDIFRSGTDSLIKSKRPNADTLTMTAVLAAILTGRSLSALMTILLSDIAELMTAFTMEKTRNAISDMLGSTDDQVYLVLEDGSLKLTDVSEVKLGDIVSVQLGDKLSVDGLVYEGEAYLDQAPITGEFFPAHKTQGDQVFAGTIVKSGQLRIKVNRIGDNTTVARIVHMVEDAASKKAQIQTYADRFSAQLIPLNFLLAGGMLLYSRDVNRALSMLIIDYSCGVRLSTATALSACIYNAARNGVLIKGGNYVEALAAADALVLDKTGTITEGKPKIISMVSAEGTDQKTLLETAAAAEDSSSHPIAYSILEKTRRMGYTVPAHGPAIVEVGKGIATDIEGEIVLVGNKKYMKDSEISTEHLELQALGIEQKGETLIYVARGGRCIGVIGVHDSLKENVKKALNRLRNLGFDDIRLLTGDLAFQAEKVAAKMHMDDYQAELMPEEKAQTVLGMQSNGARVIMIGDGINDAPALAYADVGIAIGNTRTDVAIESANVTITNDDPLLIPSAIQLSRSTMKIIKENFALVIGINSVGIALSAMGFLPVIWGSVLHNSSTIFVVLNSGRLLIKDFERRSVS